MRKGALVISALLAVSMLVQTGCLQRRIKVTSEPSGARVWLNDEPIGITPCEARFTYYGRYDIRLELEGHEPISEGRFAHAPIQEYPIIDLVGTLAPFDIEHEIDWHYDLIPIERTDEARDALRERADLMRSSAATPD